MIPPPTRREAPLAAALASLLLLSSAPRASATTAVSYGARRTVYYQDAACRLESFREYAYSARSMEADHSTREVDFGQCYARGSTGAITTCDPTDGTSTIETYLDTNCQQHLYSSKESPACENLRVDGHSCPAGGPASATSDCTNMSPYPSINPGTFNLVGSPYNDRMCEQRAGGDHIVSGEAFGVGNRECTLSTLVRGPLFSLSECMDDGTVYGKVFGPEDTNCSEELHLEVLMFPRAAQADMTGGICALGVFEDGRREYYRLKACTTNVETPKEPISATPAPTAHANMVFFDDDETLGEPAPVDYRGDGDDEDLRDGGDDDDGTSSYLDSGDDSVAIKDKDSGEDSQDHSSSEGEDPDSDDGDDQSGDDKGDGHDDEHDDDDKGDGHDKEHDDDDCGEEHDGDSDDSLTGSMAHQWPKDGESDDDSGTHHHHHRDGEDGESSSGDDYHHHSSGDDDHHGDHHHGDDTNDDDVHSSHEDGSGLGDGDSHRGSSDDDGDGHDHGSDDDGDGGGRGSDDDGDGGGGGDRDDDDLDANASGRGGDVDGDGDDGLTGNGIFAIVFGVAVSFSICILSFVLATAGDNRSKVGPKP